MHHTIARRKKARCLSFLLTFFGIIALVALPVGFLAPLQPAAQAAAAFVVNSTGDGADSDLGDGVCNDGSGNCTLRAAIQQANQLDGADTISFSITGTILLSSELPWLTSMTITGPGSAQLNVRRDPGAATSFRIFRTELSSTVGISGLTVSGGRMPGDHGGGIYNRQSLSLTDVVVRDNETLANFIQNAGRGGGIYHDGSALTLTNCTVSDNSAADGLFGGPPGGRDGGGIYLNGGGANITRSTISGNRTGDGVSGGSPGKGGGIYVAPNASATMANCTVSGNSVGGGFGGFPQGGGIFNASTSQVVLVTCTVANNTASASGLSNGGGIASMAGNTSLRNTIVANNTAANGPDIDGEVTSLDFNLIRTTAGATISGTTTHNVTGVDPLLSPLQNNEGPTRAHALLPGSPAIDAGNSGGLTTDQRGRARPVDNPSAANASDGADIGAYEAQAATPAGTIQFSADSYAAAEGAGVATITVTRAGGSAGAVSASFSTSDGTARAGEDYTAVSGLTVTFADGDSAPKTVAVPITDDVLNEPGETVSLSLSNLAGGAAFGSPAAATLTIADNNDPLPALSINDLSHPEGNANTTDAQFTVTLSPASGFPVTVAFGTTPGTATSGGDYFPGGMTLSFAPGEVSKSAPITVRGDRAVEPDETFFVNLSNPTNATISDGQGLGTIVNDDSGPPGLKFTVANNFVVEGSASSMTVTRTGDISGAVAVDYATSDGTASSKGDYTTTIGTLRFAAGEHTKSFDVPVIDDRFDEPNETVNLTLSNPTGATLGEPATATVTIQDNDAADGPSPVREQSFETRFFVRQHYLDFLGREPDQGGLDFWAGGIDSCGTDSGCLFNKKIDTSAAFFLSIEFQETGFLVHRMYKTAYGEADGSAIVNNVPTPIKVPVVRLSEFLLDSQRIARDVIVGTPGWPERLTANKAAFALEFVQRSRFTTAFPPSMSPEAFTNALIANAGITLEESEKQALINELAGNNTAAGRASVLQQIAESEELVSIETNKAFVLMQYFGYLRRNPNDPQDTDHSGYNFWLQKLNGFNGDWRAAQMVEAFIDSIEYKQRFGQP